MGRKGKGVAGSSSNPETEQPKRRRLVLQEEEEEVHHVKPNWTSGPLSEQEERWQAELFHDQMKTLVNKKEGFICEKEVKDKEFGPFGVYDKFKALGWEAALRCYDNDDRHLFMDEIEEWMATLRCPGYKKPSEMRLIGTVGGIEVTMSFESLRQIARFDSKAANKYQFPDLDALYFKPDKHPTWDAMVEDLFLPGRGQGKLYRRYLKIEAKLLLMICQQNVIPRRGDKLEVRYPEVPILYALMHGKPLIPIRYLMINNIWISRESVGRKIVPHCRLITALLKLYGAIDDDAVGESKRHTPFDLKKLGSGWKYQESERYHKLKSEGQRWRALKVDARSLRPGESEEMDSGDDVPQSGDEDYEDAAGEDMPMETEGAGSSRPTRARGSPLELFDPNWAHQGTMHDVVKNARPHEFYSRPETTRALYDHQTVIGASHERAEKQRYDSQDLWNSTHAYAFQQEINHRYEDDRMRRMHDAWHAGQPVVADPMILDYVALPPYDGSVTYPTPPLHHSMWVDPRHDQATQEPAQQQGGTEEGAFGFGEFTDVMISIFGPPQPHYF